MFLYNVLKRCNGWFCLASYTLFFTVLGQGVEGLFLRIGKGCRCIFCIYRVPDSSIRVGEKGEGESGKWKATPWVFKSRCDGVALALGREARPLITGGFGDV
jgi:hypothetical protein